MKINTKNFPLEPRKQNKTQATSTKIIDLDEVKKRNNNKNTTKYNTLEKGTPVPVSPLWNGKVTRWLVVWGNNMIRPFRSSTPSAFSGETLSYIRCVQVCKLSIHDNYYCEFWTWTLDSSLLSYLFYLTKGWLPICLIGAPMDPRIRCCVWALYTFSN